MAVLVAALPASTTEDVLPHKTWTRDELRLIEATGVFEGTHFELIEGDLIDKMGKNWPHLLLTQFLVETFRAAFPKGHVVQESPMDVAPQDNPRNQPEPDVMVLRQPLRKLARVPASEDVLLIVEIADATLRQDLTTKARLYARAGVIDYWVVDVKNKSLVVFRKPVGDQYNQRLDLKVGESIAPLGSPDHTVALSDLFQDLPQ